MLNIKKKLNSLGVIRLDFWSHWIQIWSHNWSLIEILYAFIYIMNIITRHNPVNFISASFWISNLIREKRFKLRNPLFHFVVFVVLGCNHFTQYAFVDIHYPLNICWFHHSLEIGPINIAKFLWKSESNDTKYSAERIKNWVQHFNLIPLIESWSRFSNKLMDQNLYIINFS